MKDQISSLLAISLMAILVLSCNQKDAEMSTQHQVIAQTNEELKERTAQWMIKIEDAGEVTDDLLKEARAQMQVDSTLIATLIEHQSLLAKNAGILKKHQLIIENHREYIDQHEKSALTPAEIKAQHARIQEDLKVINNDLVSVEKDWKGLTDQQVELRKKIKSDRTG